MMAVEALGAASFFEKIFKELWQSVYLALGGSVDDGLDWASRWTYFAGVGIKIIILLAIIGTMYWFLVYSLKHVRNFLSLSDRQVSVVRSTLRYLWLVLSLISIMTQVGAQITTIKAVAKAAGWAGFYYVMWAMSAQMVHGLIKHYDINASVEQLLHNMLVVLIVVLAAATVMAQFGFDIVSIVAGLGIAGLAVGFAAQSTLANFIAGIAILIEQSFQVGDWIRIGTQEGRVVKISLRTTHILDRDNIIIIFPNSTVASSEVVNLTSKTFIRFDVPVRVALNADIDKVRSLVLATLKANEEVLPHPLATVTLDRIGEYDMFFIVRFWLSPASVARLPIIKEHIIESIKLSLDGENIKPPYPHMRLIKDDVDNQDITSDKQVIIPISSAQAIKDDDVYGNRLNPRHQFPDGS